MPRMQQTSVRFTAAQIRMLERLSSKLQLDRTNVLRLAIARLAEAEGLSRAPDRESPRRASHS